jgi:O-methyltransferase involved in polyketide biosynthesis
MKYGNLELATTYHDELDKLKDILKRMSNTSEILVTFRNGHSEKIGTMTLVMHDEITKKLIEEGIKFFKAWEEKVKTELESL